MTDRMWEATTNHARTCEPDDKVYVYAAPHGTIYVNSVFKLVRVEIGGVEWPLQQLRGHTVSLRSPSCLPSSVRTERRSSVDSFFSDTSRSGSSR
jgi:hypothetical protein